MNTEYIYIAGAVLILFVLMIISVRKSGYEVFNLSDRTFTNGSNTFNFHQGGARGTYNNSITFTTVKRSNNTFLLSTRNFGVLVIFDGDKLTVSSSSVPNIKKGQVYTQGVQRSLKLPSDQVDSNTLQIPYAPQPAAPQVTSTSGKIGLPSAQVDPNTLQIPSAPQPAAPQAPSPYDKIGAPSIPIDSNTLQYITGPPAPQTMPPAYQLNIRPTRPLPNTQTAQNFELVDIAEVKFTPGKNFTQITVSGVSMGFPKQQTVQLLMNGAIITTVDSSLIASARQFDVDVKDILPNTYYTFRIRYQDGTFGKNEIKIASDIFTFYPSIDIYLNYYILYAQSNYNIPFNIRINNDQITYSDKLIKGVQINTKLIPNTQYTCYITYRNITDQKIITTPSCYSTDDINDAIILVDTTLWNYKESNQSKPLGLTTFAGCFGKYHSKIKEKLGGVEPATLFRFTNPANTIIGNGFEGMDKIKAAYWMDGYNNIVNDRQLTNDIVKYTIINLFPFASDTNPEPMKLYPIRTKLNKNLGILRDQRIITQSEFDNIKLKDGKPNRPVCVTVLNKLLKLKGFPTI